MFTFLNSAILFGLAAITIPILIHLFTRQKAKTVYFSSLKFLKELQKQKIRRLKLRQILLLVLRTLLILLLVLAFARPTLKSTGAASLESGAQLTAVLILDNTLSMGLESDGQRQLNRAKKRALEIVNSLRPGDEIYLLYPQNPPKFANEEPRYSPESIRELIENTELSYRDTDYLAALDMANEVMMKSSNINREIYLVGDMQKNGWKLPKSKDGESLLAENVKLFILPLTDGNAENLSVQALTLTNQILEKGKVMAVEAVIKNTGQIPVRNKLAHLFMNGKRVGQDAFDLAPQASTKVVFRVVPDQTGFQSGYVLLEDDDLVEDNRRDFTFTIPEEIPVLLVGNQERDTYYINLALRPQKEVASFFKVDEISYKNMGQENLDNYKVMIFSNVPKIDYTQSLRIQNFVKSGGGLIVFLGADVDLRSYNENLHKKLNLPDLTQSITSSQQDQFLSLGKIDFSHPIFKGVFDEEKAVESPHFRFAINVNARQPSETIIEYNNQSPFLFESQYQKGRILYVTTGISQEWSDLAFRGIFVPLINRSVMYLAGSASSQSDNIAVGEEISYSPDVEDLDAGLEMERPDQVQVKIKPQVAQGNYVVRFTETDLAGVYKLRHNQQVLAQWAVNINPEESETTAFATDELSQTFKQQQIYEIQANDNIAEKLQETRFGRELWKTLMILALVFLLLETVLFKEKWYNKNKPQEV